MIEFLIGWLSIVVIVGCICLTACYAVSMYYKNQKEIRLEQMDVQLQNPELAADTLSLKRITQIYRENAEYEALLRANIRRELLSRNLIKE